MVVYDNARDSIGVLQHLEFKVGVYEVEFDCGSIPVSILPVPSQVVGREFEIKGKLCRIEGLRYVYGTSEILGVTYRAGLEKCIVTVRVLQNPLPALAVILGMAAILAVASGWLVLQVRQLSEENPAAAGVIGAGVGLGVLLLPILVVYAAYRWLKR